MKVMETRVKKWGNSMGILIPKDIIEKEHIKEGAEVEIVLTLKNKTTVNDIFGAIKLKRPTDKILKEVDEDLWPD